MVAFVPWLGGCSSVAAFRGVNVAEQALYVRGVPPLRQDARYSCGPVSVAAVAAHWGVDPADFLRQCPAMAGEVSGRELQGLAASLGVRGFLYRGSLADLRENLRKGRPMIVMLPKPPDPAWRQAGLAGALAHGWSERLPRPRHWVVVVGILADGRVIIHDPAAGPITVRGASFDRWWARMEQLCLLVMRV